MILPYLFLILNFQKRYKENTTNKEFHSKSFAAMLDYCYIKLGQLTYPFCIYLLPVALKSQYSNDYLQAQIFHVYTTFRKYHILAPFF